MLDAAQMMNYLSAGVLKIQPQHLEDIKVLACEKQRNCTGS